MSTRQKRYCPQCRIRVSRSAKKCGYCGRRLLRFGAPYLIAFIAIGLLLFWGIYKVS